MKKSITFLLISILICACNIDEQSADIEQSPVFTATIEDNSDASSTRVYVDSLLQMHWSEGDQISVFTDSRNRQYQFTGKSGDTKGTFEEVQKAASGAFAAASANYAVFPYSSSTVLNQDETISMIFPSVQSFANRAQGSLSGTMVAVTSSPTDYNLSFKNLCSYMVVRLYGEGKVKSVSLAGNNGEKLAGPAVVTASHDWEPSVVFGENATDTITILCNGGVTLGTDKDNATEFWFSIPPVTFSEGFTVKVTSEDNVSFELETSANRSLTRSHKVAMAPKFTRFKKDMPPVNEGAAKTGIYRNYFRELGIPQADIDKKIAETYAEIFENPTRGAYFDVTVDNKKMGYVTDVKNSDVRSEGMSYGMMIAVQLNKPELFNKIWRWANKYMRHNESGASNGLFAWQCRTDGSRISQGSASDGELYFVTTLLLAARRWKEYEEFNYLTEAKTLLNQLFSKTGGKSGYNIINMDKMLINFCPDFNSNNHTDPSYHLPAFYEIWAETADDGREATYRTLAEKAREYLHLATDPVTGINPDQSYYDGKPFYGWGWPTDSFHYDSWRVPMNIAMDYAWYHKDAEWQSGYATRMVNTVVGRYGLTTFPDQFALDGGKPGWIVGPGTGAGAGPAILRHSIGFVGTMATTSMMIDGEYSQDLVYHMFDQKLEPYSDKFYDVYYDGLLYLFALLHLSGNYRMNW